VPWRTGFSHGFNGSWVAGLRGSGLRVSRVFTGDRVAGVLWSRRRHPPEDRTPSPSTLPISSRSQHLSLSTLNSLSHHLSVTRAEGRTKEKRRTEEEESGGRAVREVGGERVDRIGFCPSFSFLFLFLKPPYSLNYNIAPTHLVLSFLNCYLTPYI
jgi:hypothetical protein